MRHDRRVAIERYRHGMHIHADTVAQQSATRFSEGSTDITAMVLSSTDLKSAHNLMVTEDLPAPPVPVMPNTAPRILINCCA